LKGRGGSQRIGRVVEGVTIHPKIYSPDEKNSFRLLHLFPLISKVRHLVRSISWQQ
jgi:hypothetical protein